MTDILVGGMSDALYRKRAITLDVGSGVIDLLMRGSDPRSDRRTHQTPTQINN